MLQCPNHNCQTPNSEASRFCYKCRFPLPKRYLWAVGDFADRFRLGDLVGDRYLCKGSRIFLDTQPGLPPDTLIDLPADVLCYLRLAPYQLHIPQVYGWVDAALGPDTRTRLLLLERAALFTPLSHPPISATNPSKKLESAQQVQILPALADVWPTTPPLRQLNWLWQIAQLWQPLFNEGAVAGLLTPPILRVEGPLVRLLYLPMGGRQAPAVSQQPTLAALGSLWLQWVPQAHPDIAAFLEALCQQLSEGHIRNAEQLMAHLDQAMKLASQPHFCRVDVATRTDQGPSRPRNEDACYPASGTVESHKVGGKRSPESADPILVMVCDGIGGHQGGDVASRLAIDTLHHHLQPQPLHQLAPSDLISELIQATYAANDAISQRNDGEQRRDRQRMGTTLVFSLIRDAECFITHVGDSRAYWITPWGCHQVTLDDDVASREMRLGYGTYRNALYHPSAGSLIQALGMGSSHTLHPTVQRFMLEGTGVLLLCSDGLSDNELIETCWDTILLPLLEKGGDLANANQQLIELANTRNGYDNVTVGLIRWQMTPSTTVPIPATLALPGPQVARSQATRLQLGQKTHLQLPPEKSAIPDDPPTAPQDRPTRLVAPQIEPPVGDSPSPQRPDLLPSRQGLWSLVVGILVLLGVGGALAAVFVPSLGDRLSRLLDSPPSPDEASVPPAPSSDNPASGSDLDALPPLPVGSFIQVSQAGHNRGDSPEASEDFLVLLPAPPGAPAAIAPSAASIPPAPGSSITASSPAEETTPSTGSMITVPGVVPLGSIVQILSKQKVSGQEQWVRLKICSTPSAPPQALLSSPAASTPANPSVATAPETPLPSDASTLPVLQPGQVGWLEELAIAPQTPLDPSLSPPQLGACSLQPES
ncbi:MAG: protein phosphatase 2C domain-containing protein [Synechococcales bacterium]|nr:protein phosphatase 2C domain-containing protein [Synechococcales bacterium]